MEDYRIAAALINRFFKRIYSDKDENDLGQKMKFRLNKENDLNNYVLENKSHLKSKNTRIESCSLVDFPVLTKEMIKSNLTFGTYQLKQSLSYLAEHLYNGKFELLINKEKIDKDGKKILFAEIQSRHRNAIKYRSFIKYSPYSNDSNAICSWYCTCLSGSRTIGCCSHIASIVYYLSFARHSSDFSISYPASHLDNFFHVAESSDSESDSNCDKNDCDSFSDSGSSNSEDEFESNESANEKSSILETESANEKSSILETESANEKSSILELESLTEPEILSQELNRSISIKPNIEWLVDYIPFWGGSMIDQNGKKTSTSITNTCTIDYFLFSIWLSTKMSDNCFQKISSLRQPQKFFDIIDCIDKKKWDKAKTIWLVDICNKIPLGEKKKKN